MRTYTAAEIAERWCTCVETVHAVRKAGTLRAFSISPPGARKKHWRFSEDALIAFEMQQANREPPAPRARPRRQRDTAGVIEFF